MEAPRPLEGDTLADRVHDICARAARIWDYVSDQLVANQRSSVPTLAPYEVGDAVLLHRPTCS